ncbi:MULTISPECIES: ROK family protein [unclassified Streptococcus]|uniref:ROK family protein n=1 Tax=unclassified Streptococcus TaxID=2608887 RepID=UPI00107265AC|nr:MULTISPECIES: ROK family protein [unclassified Streptococcus]MBF0786882.1 ROK family protein [Streptococcus sp. 19428wC2_LYSM12]MCQ9212707.1 ROK family protein [Streptococcus sp. B01]MCQ9214048.1 ROK family protein [Streptococcus sp. O1]TFV06251.1 ROK family protein [Streptococcus sp. LYSM12]
MTYYLAIDIGGTFIKFGILDSNEHFLEQDKMETNAHRGGPHILKTVKELVKWYRSKYPLTGVCISTAGMVDPIEGTVFYAGPQIPNYAGTCFKKEIEAAFHIPCEVENDVNCAGLAERVSGSGKNSKISVCLTIGTGIGGCLLLDKQVFHGHSYSACEVGYLQLSEGSFQDLASTSALVRFVAQQENDLESEWSGLRIFEEAKLGNKNCILGIERMVHYLAAGIANICYVVNPETIILGGGIMSQKEYLANKIRDAGNEKLVPALAENLNLVFAQHENSAGMLGAYYHFRERMKQ